MIFCIFGSNHPKNPKNGHFSHLTARKTAKNAKIKISYVTFFLSPTRMLYTKFQPNWINIPKQVTFFIFFQIFGFCVFSAKFGPKWPKFGPKIPIYGSSTENSQILTGYLVINQGVTYNYQFLGYFKHFWTFYLIFCIFGSKQLSVDP